MSITHETTSGPQISSMKIALIMLGLCLAVLLTGMDQTILATAAPTISDQFNSLDDIAWWTDIYLLTLSSFQLFYGKLYSLFSIKLIYISAIVIFEIGSLICTTAPNSLALIVGRAIAGLGASGIFSGGVLITTKIIPLSRRPAYLGIMSAVFGVAAIAGPFIGGALTDKSTWRWCFGINLPLGAFTILICLLLVETPAEPTVLSLRWKEKLQQFDVLGTTLMVTGLICLLLGLQWGGGMYSWHDGRVIALLVLAAVLLVTFAALQITTRVSKTRTLPPTITKNYNIWLAASYAVGITGGIYVAMVYLPFWFQIIRNKTSLQSGTLLTPTIGAYVLGSVISGGVTSATGYYNLGMILGTILLVSGAAVLTTLEPSTPISRVIGYELLYGLGAGFGFGQPTYVVQTILPECDVAIGVTFITLLQNLSAAIFVAVAQTVFQNRLRANLAAISTQITTTDFLQTGASDLFRSISPADRPKLLEAFSDALVKTFYICVVVACITVFGTVGSRWTSMKTAKIPVSQESAIDRSDQNTREEKEEESGPAPPETTNVPES